MIIYILMALAALAAGPAPSTCEEGSDKKAALRQCQTIENRADRVVCQEQVRAYWRAVR